MNRSTTVDSYQARITRVIDYIYDHLDDDLDLEKLAEIACFSNFHWHRIYRSITGETIKKTVKRLRLHRAAKELISSDDSLEKIARRAGYRNKDSFNRSFAYDFDMPPGAYRKRGQLIVNKINNAIKDTTMYDVNITSISDTTLAAIDHTGPYIMIGQAFDKVFAWAGANGLFGPKMHVMGIFYDDPAAVDTDKLRSKGGITVDSDFEETADIKKIIIEGGRYAVCQFKGPYAELETAYSWLFGSWLPESGEEVADKPCFEDYLNNPKEVPPSELLTNIFLPLKA